jgi:hypothetical protein
MRMSDRIRFSPGRGDDCDPALMARARGAEELWRLMGDEVDEQGDEANGRG